MTVAEMTRRNRKHESTVAAVPPSPARLLTDAERSEVAVYEECRRTRLRPPRFGPTSGDAPGGTESVSPAADVDADLFRARLAKAVGAVDQHSIGQLLSQAAYSIEGSEPVLQCNAAAALLTGIAPRNEVEGMLGVQMLAAHNLALAMALLRTFSLQTEALARLRGQTGQQTVRVEHVTIEAGGQAVVGAVTTGRGMLASNAKRPHAPRARSLLRNGNLQGDPTTAPRCGARTRRGRPCQGPCVRGRTRCRMHGGAAGSGGQLRNRNAWRHGEYSSERKAELRALRALLCELRGDAQRIIDG